MKNLIYSLFALLLLASCTKETNCDCDYLIGKKWERTNFDALSIDVISNDSLDVFYNGGVLRFGYEYIQQPDDERLQCHLKIIKESTTGGHTRTDGLRVSRLDCDSETFMNCCDVTWYRID